MLDLEFMQRAVIACTVISATAPLVGSFIVQRGQSLLGDGMGHIAFAGVGLALLSGIHPIIGALGLALLAAVALVPMSKRQGGGDLPLALLFYGGISAGFLFAARAGGGQASVVGLLFGSPLNLQWGEVAAITGLAGVVLVIVAVVYRQLLAMAFDEASAKVAGIPTQTLTLVLTLMVALVVVAGMTTIGLLLISAMMVVPVAAATEIATSYRATLAISSGIGALSSVLGLAASYYWNFAPGAAIVVVAIMFYVIASLGAVVSSWHGRREDAAVPAG